MGFFDIFNVKSRKKALLKVARDIGFDYEENPDQGLLEILEDFEICHRGYGRKMSHLFSAGQETKDTSVQIFDYRYKVDHHDSDGDVDTVYYDQTLILLTSKHLNLPHFKLSPKSFFSKLGNIFVKELTLNDPEFTKRFHIHTAEVEHMKEILNSRFKSLLLSTEDFSLEGMNFFMLMYVDDKFLAAKSESYEGVFSFMFKLAGSINSNIN